ncbi:amidohydrolase family protein [Reichenbachiella ulvae]|uniref:Amidohydrolase family protein n=1 Tax=Reichenbachiella ulvae TaxID=2980104 RepID=A0ABT3CTR5_9BACT|nr:amidohydrolase family protein [Reichenbachiella ulvae]MCV9387095.1 amidohydrolase family protein [Reichenbachiella ulvae]
MKSIGNILLVLCSLLSSLPTVAQEKLSDETLEFVTYQAGNYHLKNLTIIDGTGSEVKENHDILISGDLITRIGQDLKTPKGATVIDMTGKSAMPGMVMLHEHMFYPKSTPEKTYGVDQMSFSFPRLYLAGGATTIRTAGSIMPQSDINLKKAINQGKIPGPNMDVTSPHLDREGVSILELPTLETTQQFVDAVNFYADMGVTSFKVYNFITREDLKAIVETAHARGMKVTGHLCSITYREAADIGIDNLEHGFFTASDFIKDKETDQCAPFELHQSLLNLPVESKEMSSLIDHLVKKEVALTSTINVFEPYTDREVLPGGGLEALYSGSKEKVYNRWARKQGNDSLDYINFNKGKIWEKAFYNAGGLLVAGTDPTYDGRIVAGYANMRLLELFVEMGFTVPEAVKICTVNGAKYLEQESEIGSIEKGKKADLIIINGDLSQDIANIRKDKIVFKNGVGYNSPKLFDSAKGYVGIR